MKTHIVNINLKNFRLKPGQCIMQFFRFWFLKYIIAVRSRFFSTVSHKYRLLRIVIGVKDCGENKKVLPIGGEYF